MLNRISALLVLLTVVSPLAAADNAKKAKRVNPAFLPVTDVAGLPRVLLIGDSISIGYTVPVQKALEGKANVHRIPTNGGPTTRGIASLESWLGDGSWDVVHFNFGLHDLKYVDGKNKNTSIENGHQQVAPDDYRKNLTTIVKRLEQTGAKLIWRPTTPVPADAVSRIVHAEDEYNAIAEEVIKGRGIAVNDLNAAIDSHPNYQLPANVHFTPAGSKALGELVAGSILAALND